MIRVVFSIEHPVLTLIFLQCLTCADEQVNLLYRRCTLRETPEASSRQVIRNKIM